MALAHLLIDMGNSALKWAWLRDGVLGQQQRLSYAPQIEMVFQQAWQHSGFAPNTVWVCNVAGADKELALQAWLKHQWQCPVHFFQTQAYACGVKNSYAQFQKLGVDRWLTLLGAHMQFKQPVCIVDCGTAMTLDMLDADGEHQGGLISAGIDLMRQTLAQGTAALPSVSNQVPLPLLNNDTETALLAGTAYSAVALIEYTLQQCVAETKLVMTGGGADAVLPLLQRPYHHLPDLVLQGMQVMVQQCEL